VVIGGNMPKVKFLQDFQGKETGEIFYKLGQVADLPDHMTAILVADRRAELVKEDDAPIVYENVNGAQIGYADEEKSQLVSIDFTDTPIYSEPDIFVEPQEEEKPEVIEDVITTEKVQPKRGKRGKK
jgi:hypothetical protein